MSGSTTSGVLKLQDVRDAILANEWVNYNPQNDPGQLWAWGSGDTGGLGTNDTTNRSSPVQVPGSSWTVINSGSAIKSDRTLWTWGVNTDGRLGVNDQISRSSPVQVPGTSWTQVTTVERGHTLALKSDNTLWVWGSNYSGQLGQNDRGNFTCRLSPVQIPGTSWTQVSAGSGQFGTSFARKSDGTLWAWGRNNNGELGLNNVADRSSPVQIPGTSWVDICAGNYFNLARKTDGTLWSWGRNSFEAGSLGTNDTISRSSPAQVPGTSWVEMSAGSRYSMARKSDGTLWVWGCNYSGRLGQNNITDRSSPIQVPGTAWVQIAAGNAALARKSDGTLWAWGGSEAFGSKPAPGAGEVGDNSAVNRSSPVQIPGTAWISISAAGGTRSFARKSN